MLKIELLQRENLQLPEKWSTLRPEQLSPPQFLELTIDLFGERNAKESEASLPAAAAGGEAAAMDATVASSETSSEGSDSNAQGMRMGQGELFTRGEIVWRRKRVEIRARRSSRLEPVAVANEISSD